MLPPELLRHIFSFIEDVECFDTVRCQPVPRRYLVEMERGRRNIQTKSALLLVSWQFYEIAIELAWSWISIYSSTRLLWMDGVITKRIPSKSLMHLDRHRNTTQSYTDTIENNGYHLPGCWIRRLDIVISAPNDLAYSHQSRIVAHILRACTNLRVFVSDISVKSVDCQRTASFVLDALKSLRHLTRLDWAGHEGPSFEDYIHLLPHLTKLEQWTTGRMASPHLSDKEVIQLLQQDGEEDSEQSEEKEARAIVLRNLKVIQVSDRPVYSCLRLISHLDLPSLTHLAFRHLDFQPRTNSLFSALGHQITHIYTHDIRTSVGPFGYAHVLVICPNLQHLTFSPRLRDERHQQSWRHARLRSLGLRAVLPLTMPKEDQLANNIASSLETFLRHVSGARIASDLPCLTTIRIEDSDDAALEYETRFGGAWNELCCAAGIRLEDTKGRRIPSELPPISTVAPQDVHEGTDRVNPRRKRPPILKRIFGHVVGGMRRKRK